MAQKSPKSANEAGGGVLAGHPTPGQVCPGRFKARAAGRVQTATLSHQAANPRFEVTLDVKEAALLEPGGSGQGSSHLNAAQGQRELLTDIRRLTLIWQGQRQVHGIEAGGYLQVSGLLSPAGATATMYNPRYEILS